MRTRRGPDPTGSSAAIAWGSMSDGPVIVIGGGLVGLSCAWFLREAGLEVVVLERGDPGGGASRGNAGAICPSMVEPLPAPGILRGGIGSMTRPDAALHVAPTYAPRLAGFLRRFAQAATRERFEAGVDALLPFALGVTEAYDELAAAGIGAHARADGYLFVHASWQAAHDEREHLLAMAARGVCEEPEEVLDGADLREVAPVLTDAAAAGFVLPGERWIEPGRLVDDLAASIDDAGVDLRTVAGVTGIEASPDGVTVRTTEGSVDGATAVVAAGVWTRDLVAPLGLRLPLHRARATASRSRPTDAGPRALPPRCPRDGHAVRRTPADRRHDGVRRHDRSLQRPTDRRDREGRAAAPARRPRPPGRRMGRAAPDHTRRAAVPGVAPRVRARGGRRRPQHARADAGADHRTHDRAARRHRRRRARPDAVLAARYGRD